MAKKIIIGVISSILMLFILFIVFYNINLSATNKNEEILFYVNIGDSATSVISKLKEEDLIKSEFVTKLYGYLNKKLAFQAGKYSLNGNMNVDEILTKLNKGDVIKDNITLTLVEGKRLVDYAYIIANTFNFSEEEVLNTLSDKEYLQELINEYWFIDESILNDKIYYPLEGYLYPDTYEYDKDSSIKDVINKLIYTLGTKIKDYKDDIEKSNYSFHELLTLASIIESEAASKEDRLLVSGVFYNRLNNNWTLGSDVTSYYGVHKTYSDTIYYEDLINCNAYNTRSDCVKTLPVGPINSPSITSIYAAVYPSENDYFYFVADSNKKVYFSKTSQEQAKVISELKEAGLWL